MPVFGLPRKPRIIPGDGDAELVALLAAAKSRDWAAVRAGLAKHSGDDLTSLIDQVCLRTPDLGEWLPPAPADALTLAVLGRDTVKQAWAVRTAQRATNVSRDQFAEFHRLLGEAEEFLYRSAELDAESVAPWPSLVLSGRGLEVGLDTIQRRFDAAVARCPGHFGAHRHMLQALCRKWAGSHEQMHAFATEAMRGPHGDVLGVLVPQAYYEHYAYLGGRSPERAFIHSAEAQAELREAADRTLFRPGYSYARNPYRAANVFAWAFTTARMWPEAKAAFKAADGVVVNWAPFRDPKQVFKEQRALAFR